MKKNILTLTFMSSLFMTLSLSCSRNSGESSPPLRDEFSDQKPPLVAQAPASIEKMADAKSPREIIEHMNSLPIELGHSAGGIVLGKTHMPTYNEAQLWLSVQTNKFVSVNAGSNCIEQVSPKGELECGRPLSIMVFKDYRGALSFVDDFGRTQNLYMGAPFGDLVDLSQKAERESFFHALYRQFYLSTENNDVKNCFEAKEPLSQLPLCTYKDLEETARISFNGFEGEYALIFIDKNEEGRGPSLKQIQFGQYPLLYFPGLLQKQGALIQKKKIKIYFDIVDGEFLYSLSPVDEGSPPEEEATVQMLGSLGMSQKFNENIIPQNYNPHPTLNAFQSTHSQGVSYFFDRNDNNQLYPGSEFFKRVITDKAILKKIKFESYTNIPLMIGKKNLKTLIEENLKDKELLKALEEALKKALKKSSEETLEKSSVEDKGLTILGKAVQKLEDKVQLWFLRTYLIKGIKKTYYYHLSILRNQYGWSASLEFLDGFDWTMARLLQTNIFRSLEKIELKDISLKGEHGVLHLSELYEKRVRLKRINEFRYRLFFRGLELVLEPIGEVVQGDLNKLVEFKVVHMEKKKILTQLKDGEPLENKLDLKNCAETPRARSMLVSIGDKIDTAINFLEEINCNYHIEYEGANLKKSVAIPNMKMTLLLDKTGTLIKKVRF